MSSDFISNIFFLKKLIELQQHLLESNSDELHGLLEKNTMNTLLSIEDFDDFTNNLKIVKNQVVDLFTATNKFMTNLVDSIEPSMLDQIDTLYNKQG